MTFLDAFDRILDGLSKVTIAICGVSLVVLTVIFGWLVYGRYVLNATPTWVEQASFLLIMVIAFLGASVGVHEKSHLGVSYFREISPKPLRRLFELITYVALAGFGAVMMVYSYQLAVFKWDTQIPLIHLPEGLRAVPATISGFLVMLYSVGHLLHFFVTPEPDIETVSE